MIRKALACAAALVVLVIAVVGLSSSAASGLGSNPTDTMYAGQITLTTNSSGYVTVNPLDNGMPAAPYRAIQLTLESPLGGTTNLPYETGVSLNNPDGCHFMVRLVNTNQSVGVQTATFRVEAMWASQDPAPVGCTA